MTNRRSILARIIFSIGAVLVLPFFLFAQEHTLVVYNVENMFDADGIAVFDDYKTKDKEGNDQYTSYDVYTKISNVARVLKQYNNGAGPDIVLFNEIESDHSNPSTALRHDLDAFRQKYASMTLKQMLTTSFSKEIADIPSELLLLKACEDIGLTGYDMAVGAPPIENGNPIMVQKNVAFSKLPIDHSKTKIHPLQNARPILETWVKENGSYLVTFTNHWKSGAGSAKTEVDRVQNAKVLAQRIKELRKSNPDIDIVIAGDLNSNYDQALQLAGKAEVTGVDQVLLAGYDENAMIDGSKIGRYNLWYEIPSAKRGSDSYRGEWGTLMNIILDASMYDSKAWQYVDNSFNIGRFIGINALETNGLPIRWSSFGDGYGFSDHFPVSIRLSHVSQQKQTYQKHDTEVPIQAWERKVESHLPSTILEFSALPTQLSVNNFDTYYRIPVSLLENDLSKLNDNGRSLGLYFSNRKWKELAEQKMQNNSLNALVGRLTTYRGQWQFVIDGVDFIE